MDRRHFHARSRESLRPAGEHLGAFPLTPSLAFNQDAVAALVNDARVSFITILNFGLEALVFRFDLRRVPLPLCLGRGLQTLESLVRLTDFFFTAAFDLAAGPAVFALSLEHVMIVLLPMPGQCLLVAGRRVRLAALAQDLSSYQSLAQRFIRLADLRAGKGAEDHSGDQTGNDGRQSAARRVPIPKIQPEPERQPQGDEPEDSEDNAQPFAPGPARDG